MARGTAEGQDENLDTTIFGTPWSAPLTFDVRSDFRRRTGRIARPRSKRPRFTFTAEWPDVANGGRGTVKLYRITGCRGRNFKLRKVATYRGRFGAKRMRITMRRPRVVGFYLGRFSFSGTHFLNKSTDPNPMRLLALRDRVGVRPGERVPRLPGLQALIGRIDACHPGGAKWIVGSPCTSQICGWSSGTNERSPPGSRVSGTESPLGRCMMKFTGFVSSLSGIA